MNIVQQKMQTFRITDRILDLILLFVSARLAIIAERVLHYKSWHALDPQSFHFSALIIIFMIWTILIQILESLGASEAALYMQMLKKKSKVKGLTSKLVLEVFPNMYKEGV
jgi:hypothetical protein